MTASFLLSNFSSLSWSSTQALKRRVEFLQSTKNRPIDICGHTSVPALAGTLSDFCSLQESTSHVVVVPSEKEALCLKEDLHFFNPHLQCEILRGTDISPYSGLAPETRMGAERLRWIYLAKEALPQQILIAPIWALMQKTLPPLALESTQKKWVVGGSVPSPEKDLIDLGYTLSPVVEDVGQFSIRGGILDIYPPSCRHPVRVEFFGDTVDSMRLFSLKDQRSREKISSINIIPCREVLYSSDHLEQLVNKFHQWKHPNADPQWIHHQIGNFQQKRFFPGLEFYLPLVWPQLGSPFDFISDKTQLWLLDPFSIARSFDTHWLRLKSEKEKAHAASLLYPCEEFYNLYKEKSLTTKRPTIRITKINTHLDISGDLSGGLSGGISGGQNTHESMVSLKADNLDGLKKMGNQKNPTAALKWLEEKISSWHAQGYFIFACIHHQNQIKRVELLFEQLEIKCVAVKKFSENPSETSSENLSENSSENLSENPSTGELSNYEPHHWNQWFEEQTKSSTPLVHILEGQLSESLRNKDDKIIFLREKDLLGRKASRTAEKKPHQSFQESASLLSFANLKVGDNVIHRDHGIGVYQGLKTIDFEGIKTELIELLYKGDDKLYVPTYHVGLLQKYSGPQSAVVLDRLGGTKWQETKSKAKKYLKDLAAELLKNYAQRAQLERPVFSSTDEEYFLFEEEFPYTETRDQQKSIEDVQADLSKKTPMDRLLCGDVGFGKTEVAMRTAFRVLKDNRQVMVLAPTTILTFQHYESFKKRFANWPANIALLNRFVSPKETKRIISDVNSGKVNVLIGTHKILSLKIQCPNLGLLVVDEEQKFGVDQKEKLRKYRVSVDTLSMSATPIPRTLNMSLSGLRDLSLINTAPHNRQPIRTFVARFDKEIIRKAVLAERARDGQVFFLHNRVQTIYKVADQLRELLPEVRIAIGHGQMDEKVLEKTMMDFFQHKVDVLVCTTIIDSGIDVPKANTIFIDQAHTFGLSQLYQIRGRVGRSHQKAYCYLLIPENRQLDSLAQERLRVIQENTNFGSGLLIAQYDLEFRGAGNILGQEQSGQVASVGYELYMDLLNQEIQRLRGDPVEENELEPEINLSVPTLIPENYVPDVRMRLAYYKKLTQIKTEKDADVLEDELKDRFGPLPEPTVNLFGMMLIRSLCKKLHITYVSTGKKNLSLNFREDTPVDPEVILNLLKNPKEDVSLSGSHRVLIVMKDKSWPLVHSKIKDLFVGA